MTDRRKPGRPALPPEKVQVTVALKVPPETRDAMRLDPKAAKRALLRWAAAERKKAEKALTLPPKKASKESASG